jgi:hypothetical protein
LVWGLEQQFGAAFTPELLQETLSRGLIRNLGLVRFRCKEGLSGTPRPPFGHAHKDRDEERKGELRPASDRNEHYPVTYIDPRGGSTPHPWHRPRLSFKMLADNLREREAELDETFKKLKSVSLFRDNLDEVGSCPTKTRIQATLSQTKKPAGGKPAGYWKS